MLQKIAFYKTLLIPEVFTQQNIPATVKDISDNNLVHCHIIGRVPSDWQGPTI